MNPHIVRVLVLLPVTAWLAGCGHGGEASLADIEGTYVQTDNTNVMLVLKDGRYQQGTREIHAQGNYHAHEAGDGYELHIELTGPLAGNQTSLLVKRQGEGLWVKDGDTGKELTFRKAPAPGP